jgi:hypothetical protein
VQQSDVRINALDDFPLKLQNQSQHTMRSRMLRPKVDGKTSEVLAWLAQTHALHPA